MNAQLQQLADVLISDSAGGCGGRLILPRLIPDSRDDRIGRASLFQPLECRVVDVKAVGIDLGGDCDVVDLQFNQLVQIRFLERFLGGIGGRQIDRDGQEKENPQSSE